MEKTNKEMFNLIYDYAEKNAGANADEIKEYCDKQIEMLTNRATKAAARRAAKQAEPDELYEKVYATLNSEPQTSADIVAAINDPEVTKGKIIARLTKLIANGKATKEDVSIGDKKTAKGYKLA